MANETAYTVLCQARELLGKAHDKVAHACMDFRGEHHTALVGVCPAINELIEKLHGACGACQMPTKLSDLSIDDLRAILRATEASAGPDSTSARIIRRELQRKQADQGVRGEDVEGCQHD